MSNLSNFRLDTVYAITAVGTTLGGLVALSAGVRTEVVSPFVLAGAVIVGTIGLYWLLGDGHHGSE